MRVNVPAGTMARGGVQQVFSILKLGERIDVPMSASGAMTRG
jgi:hypothetical protein